jgi:histone arginine demethylase JMJD6
MSTTQDLFLSPDERYDVWVVKAAERPHLLEVHSDETKNDADPPLTDGCDIPGWRHEQLGSQHHLEVILESIGPGSTLLRRESMLPVNSNKTPWDDLRQRLFQEPVQKPQRFAYQQLQGTLHPVFERENFPAIIDGCTEFWPAMETCRFQNLVQKYGHLEWRFSDTHGETMRLDTYQKYIAGLEGRSDDAPLAIYDSQFHHDERAALLDEYQVPSCFDTDLFEYLSDDDDDDESSQRPPYRWILIGPSRSGTGLHVDPVGTHAWVTLVEGCKRWILFAPDTDRYTIHMQDPQIPSSIWFHKYYPDVLKQVEQEGRITYVEVLQCPGETVYVPAGWPHLVLNLDLSVAITHNYATEYPSMAALWSEINQAEPALASRFQAAIQRTRPDLLHDNALTAQL